MYYAVEGDKNAVLPPTDGWRSNKYGLSFPDWDIMPNVEVTNRKVCLSRTMVEPPSAALALIEETLNDPKNYLNGCDFSDFIRRFKPEELDISCDNMSELVLGKLAGRGGTREVYEATLHGRKVAVKQRIPDTGQSSMWDVLKEVSVLFQLRESENIAKLVGWCNHTIITEYAPRTLEEFMLVMLEYKKEEIPVGRALLLGLDMVRAVAQLHSVAGGPVAHNDLHLGQFLINSEGRALLQDIHEIEYTGKYHANSLTTLVDGQSGKCLYRTWPRGAPEKFVQERVVSESGDVYEVALVLWSLMTNNPYQYDPTKAGYDRNKAGSRADLTLMKGYPQDMKDLIAEAWNDDPLQRPTATELVERMESIIQNYNHKAMMDAAMPYIRLESNQSNETTLG